MQAQAEQAAVVLVGEAGPWLDVQIAAVRQAWGADVAGAYDEQRIDAQAGQAAASVVQALRTVPMWATQRLVWLRHAERLPSEELAALAQALTQASPQARLLITAASLDGRSSLRQAAKKQGCLREAAAPNASDLRELATQQAAAHGKRWHPAALQALLTALGDDDAAVQDAAERLCLYVGDAPTITPEDVEACVTRTAGESIWRLVDAVAARDAAATLRATANLLAEREAPLRIVAMVARQVRQLAKLQQGASALQAGIPPFKARSMTTAAQAFGQARLHAAFALLAQTDRLLKSSRCPPNLLLEQALLRLCTQ